MKLSFMVFKNARYLEVLWNLIKCNQFLLKKSLLYSIMVVFDSCQCMVKTTTVFKVISLQLK